MPLQLRIQFSFHCDRELWNSRKNGHRFSFYRISLTSTLSSNPKTRDEMLVVKIPPLNNTLGPITFIYCPKIGLKMNTMSSNTPNTRPNQRKLEETIKINNLLKFNISNYYHKLKWPFLNFTIFTCCAAFFLRLNRKKNEIKYFNSHDKHNCDTHTLQLGNWIAVFFFWNETNDNL